METKEEPKICTRILRKKDCLIYDSKNVIDLTRYKIWKEQAPLRKQLEEAEFLRMCKDWHS